MTVAGNVAFGLELAGMGRAEREARVREALASVAIGELADRFPDQLSGGQQQRLALARSLAMRPEVILLDEPLSNVDAALREHLRLEILQLVRAHGTTAIYITHDQSEAMALCDRLAVMQDGRLLQSGPPEELYRRPVSRFVAEFLGETNFIPASFVELRDGGAMFAAAGATIGATTAGAPKLAPGESATLSVRPESLMLTDRGTVSAGGASVLQGTLLETTYLGEIAQHIVELKGGTKLKVAEVNPAYGTRREAGSTVAVSARAEDVVVLSR
jgi:ABC-type Fe3+/spermidine/putrescine transport system ATPase subunit